MNEHSSTNTEHSTAAESSSCMTIRSSSENEKLQRVICDVLLHKRSGKSYAMSAQEICDYCASAAGSVASRERWSSFQRSVDTEMSCWRMVQAGVLVAGEGLAGARVFALAGCVMHADACFCEFAER